MASDLPLQPLPLVQVASPGHDAAWLRRARLAKWLAWASLGWLCIEGSVGVVAGIIAGSVALVGFGLGITKRGLGEKLGSSATRGEGTQNLLCAYLAAATLIGLVANTAAGIWWLDPRGRAVHSRCLRARRLANLAG